MYVQLKNICYTIVALVYSAFFQYSKNLHACRFFFFYKFYSNIKSLTKTIYRNSNYRDEPYIIKLTVSERVAVYKRHINLRWPKRRELSFKNTRSTKFNAVKYFAKRMLIIFFIWRQCIYTFVFDKISTN